MFGYIVANPKSLSEEGQQRLRSFYCGLCRTLKTRHGLMGTATLSYDLTFLALLLNALYEPAEETGRERCLAHPLKVHHYVSSTVMDYVADMNVALAYHKFRDNWLDDRNLLAAGEAAMLAKAYRRVERQYPDRCAVIEAWLQEIHDLEGADRLEIDLPVNATGRMMGELFIWPCRTEWAELLRKVGDGLGRFIYFMDAYDDLPRDLRRGSYNPLAPLRNRENYEQLCHDAMMMMVADATGAFEQLPILQDADIIRNVLYSGVWSKYVYLQEKRNAKERGAK